MKNDSECIATHNAKKKNKQTTTRNTHGELISIVDCRGLLQLNSLINYHVNTVLLMFTQLNWVHERTERKEIQNNKKNTRTIHLKKIISSICFVTTNIHTYSAFRFQNKTHDGIAPDKKKGAKKTDTTTRPENKNVNKISLIKIETIPFGLTVEGLYCCALRM